MKISNNARGVFLGTLGVLILSPDALLLRLINCDVNTLVVARAALMLTVFTTAIICFTAFRRNFRWRAILHYGVWSAIGMVCFPLAVKNTYVANTLVIMTGAPLLAAIGAAMFLRERVAAPTWAVTVAVAAGVGVIFAGEFRGGGLFGNACALAVAFSLAAGSVIIRKNHDMSFVPGLALGAFITLLSFAPFAEWGTVAKQDVVWILINGIITMPVSFLLIVSASRLLLPPEVNLLFLLETVLGPLWVWLVLTEEPPTSTLAAGVLIIIVMVCHCAWSLSRMKEQQTDK